MKNLVILVCLLFLNIRICSQTISRESFFSASGNSSNSYAQISWTLGDFQVSTYSSNAIVLTQGFLQSNLTVTNIVDIKKNNTIDLKVFPNPISDYLSLKYSADKETSIKFCIYNLNGSLVYLKDTRAKDYSETLDFRQFESGSYVLKAISDDGSFIRTFKLFYEK